MEYFLKQLCTNFKVFSNNIAFCIDEKSYTYTDLEARVATIQHYLETLGEEQYVAVVARNSIETFAVIFALWLSGKTSVPISPKTPTERNEHIIDQTGIKTVFDSGENPLSFNNTRTIDPKKLAVVTGDACLTDVSADTDLYMLFTSGSTGKPKGVRISRANLDAYLNAFFNCGYTIDSSDRCIEVFELTFDASVQCYTFPLMKGASVHTLPDDGIRFLSIMKILQKQDITFAKLTPSVIFYLQKYFDKIRLPKLRYCLFGAEAFPAELVKQWEKCVPNAEIHNVYGPTEATINCTFYRWNRESENKTRNGIASIGRAYQNMLAIVCDEKGNMIAPGTKGELCVAGPQITKGYWKNKENNERAFFEKELNGSKHRFYRTGDLVICDNDGDLMYIGRLDSQVQIDGHRVELSEIEHHARIFTGVKCIALATEKEGIVHSITLYAEKKEGNPEDLSAHLRKKLPPYMIPHKIIFVANIPLLSSGKTDRQKLLSLG